MRCAWDELLKIMPPGLRGIVDMHRNEMLQEVRLRIDRQPAFVCKDRLIRMGSAILKSDLNYIINAASQYSPWAASTAAQGFLTAPGGHRIGICGECVMDHGAVLGIRSVRSLCIRVARDFPEIAAGLPDRGSVLILGPPGSGKTTLLRSLIRKRADNDSCSLAVVDERCELFPPGIWDIPSVDVLSGCSKTQGMDMLMRTMGPNVIAVDEITSEEDCAGLLKACWCGVELLATAHAENAESLRKRNIYKPLWDAGVFQTMIIMSGDKTWRREKLLSCV